MSRNYSSTAVDTTLSSGISSGATSCVVVATTGFPAAPFVLALSAGSATQELVLVTAVGGTTLTVTRGYDSTVANTHNAGAVVRHSHAAIDFREAGTHIDATVAHGATGAVVGTTNVQTLTNKTLTAPVATGSLASFGEAWESYVPALTALTTNPTMGSSTLTGKFARIGKTVHFQVSLTIGAGFSPGSGAYFITLPTASIATPVETSIGTGTSNAGGTRQNYTLNYVFTNVFIILRCSTGGSLDGTGASGAWTAGNTLNVSGTYETA